MPYLIEFQVGSGTKTLIYGQVDYPYGAPLYKPEMAEGNPIRLYSLDKITDIFQNLEMVVQDCCADFSGTLSSDNQIQLLVCSKEL